MKSLIRIVALTGIPVSVIFTIGASAQTRGSQSAPPAGVKFQPLNIKTGLWEQTLTSKVSGELPVPPEMLNRLTPEQRARMEQRMKANSDAHARTTTHKRCLTEEDLRKNKFLDSGEDQECTSTITTSTSTSAKGRISCQSEGMKMAGALEMLAPDSEHINGSWRATADSGGHTMNVDSTFTSKWLGSSCGNVK